MTTTGHGQVRSLRALDTLRLPQMRPCGGDGEEHSSYLVEMATCRFVMRPLCIHVLFKAIVKTADENAEEKKARDQCEKHIT